MTRRNRLRLISDNKAPWVPAETAEVTADEVIFMDPETTAPIVAALRHAAATGLIDDDDAHNLASFFVGGFYWLAWDPQHHRRPERVSAADRIRGLEEELAYAEAEAELLRKRLDEREEEIALLRGRPR